jgi:prephenate dehydrogenase
VSATAGTAARGDGARADVQRVAVLGTGLIGGSIGLALARRDIEVVGFDGSAERVARAHDLGAVATVASSLAAAVRGADVVVVAVPVGHIEALAVAAFDAGAPIVTDVGSVKGPVVAGVSAARADRAPCFVGGHPMAGSEQDGVEGADADLFVGAAWVLTPTATTDATAFAAVRSLVRLVGAEAIEVEPARHDALVALVSHVPQLAASTLMDVAGAGGGEHRILMRLAAGGFRDMTRIAAGNPEIWPDILTSNRDAVLQALDAYRAALGDVRALVASGDRDGLLDMLKRTRIARRNLPVGTPPVQELVELRIPVPDRPGALAEVLTLAPPLGVNVYDFEIAHSSEGGSGVLVLVVTAGGADVFEPALAQLGYHVARGALE